MAIYCRCLVYIYIFSSNKYIILIINKISALQSGSETSQRLYNFQNKKFVETDLTAIIVQECLYKHRQDVLAYQNFT